MTHRAIMYPQPTCDNCGRFVPFQHGVNESEWWSGGFCADGKGCQKLKPVSPKEPKTDE